MSGVTFFRLLTPLLLHALRLLLELSGVATISFPVTCSRLPKTALQIQLCRILYTTLNYRRNRWRLQRCRLFQPF